MIEQDLLELKARITKSKEKLAELTGEQKGILKQLKEDFKCNSLEEANKKNKTLVASIDALDESIDSLSEAFQKKYRDRLNS